jgi:hypothetical protein
MSAGTCAILGHFPANLHARACHGQQVGRPRCHGLLDQVADDAPHGAHALKPTLAIVDAGTSVRWPCSHPSMSLINADVLCGCTVTSLSAVPPEPSITQYKEIAR